MSYIHAMTGALIAAILTAVLELPGLLLGLVAAAVYYGHVKLR